MRRETREETIVRTYWKADDGKEFINKEDCEKYENSYKFTISECFYRIKKIEVDANDMGLPYSGDEYNVYLVKPNDLEDIKIINAYIESKTGNNGGLTQKEIGKYVTLNFGYDFDYCEWADIDLRLEEVKNYMEAKKGELDAKE